MPDASVDATLNALVAAGFGAAGQRGMALSTAVFIGGSRPWYYDSIASTFLYGLAFPSFKLRLGACFHKESSSIFRLQTQMVIVLN